VPREEEVPAAYTWIAAQPDVQALVELPIFRDGREAWAMYYSTVHGKPIANGFSGYEAQSHADLAQAVAYLPEERGFEVLRRLGVSHLLVHARSHRRGKLVRLWERKYGPKGAGWVERVYVDPPIVVYRLLGSPESSSVPKRVGR